MPYNFAANSFHTKKLCSRLSSKKVHFYTRTGHFAFLTPWRVRGSVGCHLRLIGKRVVDFLLVIIELFRWGLRLRRYEQMSTGIRLFEGGGVGQFGPKFQLECDIPTNCSSSQETMHRSCIWYRPTNVHGQKFSFCHNPHA